MKFKYGIVFLVIAAFIAIGTAFAHMSCIFIGPQCYSAQMAPVQIIESAKNGTLLAPIGTVIVSVIFIVLGLYALSGAKVIRKLPLLSFGIYTIAALCIIRGVLPLQLWFRYPDKVSDVVFYVGLVWLVTGLLYFFGFRNMQKTSV
ncbi:hypothetical protein CJF42_17530 [Pseudoalteromonas sp. NBT06-2]|uniref:hypothetical protein n=1 Tax=Pseudoalteromonas sp. NBT06-2 TaxID=2025950 RepID=UPI000BA79EA7|nr:hypothetical protein [Pseudoalteromonas sp. NBT06-2]PAJ73104.1 hypothetical protein CJF42_17530 [Pseudoalteromonas sp. NBT06-2]